METIMAQASLKLLTTLKNFVEIVSVRAPHLSSEIVREAQFVLAGFADETLLHHPSGKLAHWRNHLLEEKMFGSRTAGETFFDRLAKVSYETYSDSAVLLALYLAILRMGFLGRFRGLRDRGELDRLRIRALTRITEEVNYDASSNVPVSPSAYDSTLRLSEIVKTPLRGVWRELFVACVVLCLTASIVGWIHLLTPLDTQIDRILLKISTPIS
jgi:type IV/VI secretion system ImpK/VasF family protein